MDITLTKPCEWAQLPADIINTVQTLLKKEFSDTKDPIAVTSFQNLSQVLLC